MPMFMHDSSTNSTANQSMHFWGICCESGKQYEQVVGQRFRITMAVLDPKSSSKSGDKTVSLFVIRGGVEYLLCVLKHEEILQVNLNLIFDKGENVIFYINGYGKVYLSGYQLTDSGNDVLNDENGYLCPLVEVTTNSKPGRKSRGKVAQNSTPKSILSKGKKKSDVDITDLDIADKRKKEARNRYANEDNKFEDLEFDEETESDDDDYQVEEDSESDEEESSESEDDNDEDDDDDDDDDDEDDDDDDDDDDDEEEEMKEIVFTKKSDKKRKLETVSQPKKRSRVDSPPSAVEKLKKKGSYVDDDDDSKDSSDSGALNSSIGNTPMPKKQTAMEKKSKKKKKLAEISILSEKSTKGQKSPTTAENTPNKMDTSNKMLDGGVEIQDLVVGKGPEAKVGKMVHVFYIGRLQNKHIFDSRLPGKKPFSFKLGAQQVIKGWDIGIQGMCVGGKRKLKIPPAMGYGNAGVEGIPPNSILFFTVELQAVS